MSLRIDDRWLWLGFGVFFLLAARGVRYAIEDVTRLTRLERYHDETADANREKPEDSISLDDLKILAESPHPNIANAAISMVVDRFMRQPNAYRSILKDVHSEDEATRIRARQARDFLRSWPTMSVADLSRYPRPRSGSFGSNTSSLVPDHLRRDPPPLGDNEAELTGPTPGLDVVIPSIEDPVAGWTNVPRERPAEDEAARRRRRREAMVLREGEGGVEEGDIIRPNIRA